MSEKKKVVVVGGGVAGSKIAKDLDGIVDVTLIDPYVILVLLCPVFSSLCTHRGCTWQLLLLRSSSVAFEFGRRNEMGL